MHFFIDPVGSELQVEVCANKDTEAPGFHVRVVIEVCEAVHEVDPEKPEDVGDPVAQFHIRLATLKKANRWRLPAVGQQIVFE